MVTLKDIADKTGFSLSVVSRAMNPSPDQKVAEKTRGIILAAAAELGYRPNHAASLLAKGRSASIGCFMPAMVGEMVGQIVSGLSYAANRAGFAYQLYFGNSLEDYRHFIDHCRHTSVAGMITYLPANVNPARKDDEFYTMLQSLTRKSGEIIMLNCPELDLPHVQTVCIDNYHIGKVAAEHLLKHSCQRYILLTSPVDKLVSFQLGQRYDGFSETVQKNGGLLEWVSLGKRKLYEINDLSYIDRLREILQKESCIGVFVLTDYDACIVLRQLAQAGMLHLVGKEIKLIGCDNIILSACFAPTLTTVSLLDAFFALGEISMSMLLNKLIKANINVDMDRLKPQLVVRESA